MEKREEAVIQNLKDAGCDGETIACFMAHYEAGEVKQELNAVETPEGSPGRTACVSETD